MAWRMDEAVIRGEIDNTVEGRTTGTVWLVGREEPLVLDLNGDCLRDLAGTKLSFVNPSPKAQEDASLLVALQKGLVGDMTASRRCRVPDFSTAESDGEHGERHEWRNLLSLEWFSDTNGRVVIESDAFLLEISEHEWSMDEDAEAAQALSNLHAMREFISQVVQRREPEETTESVPEMNEFEWEERLKESDRLTDAYQEVLEKYMEDPDGERKEAFVMGWDGLLDAMADQDEDDARGNIESLDFSEMEEDGEEEEDEDGWKNADEYDDDSHPLQIRAQEIALRAMDLLDRDPKPDSPAHAVVSNLLQVTGKLAGALNGRSTGYEPETGYVLAVLKRCLSWLNEAVGACQELIAVETDAEHRAALVQMRSAIFEIRDGVTELRRELK